MSYDRRGHSLSDRGPGPAPRRQDEDDLASLIEALGAGPAHLVGSSYGAAIALGLAGRRPELVRTVVAHEPPLTALSPQPAVEAQFASVQDQIAAGDAEGGTRRFPRAITIRRGDVSPAWLQETAAATADGLGRPLRVIAGAGHSPHLTTPRAFAVTIAEAIGPLRAAA